MVKNESEPMRSAASDVQQLEPIEQEQTIQEIEETTGADPAHSQQHNQSMDTNPSIHPSIDISEQK